jgi:hypothetical protein
VARPPAFADLKIINFTILLSPPNGGHKRIYLCRSVLIRVPIILFIVFLFPCLSVTFRGENVLVLLTTDFSQSYTDLLNRLRRRNVLMYKGISPAMSSLSPKANQIIFLLIRVIPCLSVVNTYLYYLPPIFHGVAQKY